MTRATKIDFATATWPVVTGCSKDGNNGCDNCYAAFQAGGRLKHLPHYVGLAGFDKNSNAQWTGKVRCNEDVLEEPLRTRKPQRYFVAPRGDLFHRQVPDEFLDKVFAVMALCPQHTFMIFTKRSERRRDYLLSRNGMGNAQLCRAINEIPAQLGNRHGALSMPLPNVWQITSVWDQESANRLIPPTLETPAAVRGVSIAPMLGPVSLSYPIPGPDLDQGGGDKICQPWIIQGLDWVIVEGESGKNARPMNPDWVRSIRDQCADAGVPFYFKQWGEWAPHIPAAGGDLGGDVRSGRVMIVHPTAWSDVEVAAATGGRSTIPGSKYMARIGKKKAGHFLDGTEHLEVPE